MKEYIIRNLVNFPLEIGNFDKYFYEAKKQLTTYLDNKKIKYSNWKLQEIECIEPTEIDNNHIHYNFIFDVDRYHIWLFKNDGEEIAKGNIFNGTYEHFNNQFKRVQIGRSYNTRITGIFWMNLRLAKEYLIQQNPELASQHPESIIMFEPEVDTFKKNVIFGFRFANDKDYSVFCSQPKGFAAPYEIMNRYFNSGEARILFGEELDPMV